MAKITIYGKADCPHTGRARKHYAAADVEYIDVKRDPESLARMLVLSRRRRAVPVIVIAGAAPGGVMGGE